MGTSGAEQATAKHNMGSSSAKKANLLKVSEFFIFRILISNTDPAFLASCLGLEILKKYLQMDNLSIADIKSSFDYANNNFFTYSVGAISNFY